MRAASRILITGFDGFPGSPKNPTARMIAALEKYRPRFARAGIYLELAILPVVYDEIESRLDALVRETKPDAILHFGVAARRTKLSVETRALNRMSLLHPDASGTRPKDRTIIAHAPPSLASTLPCGLVAARLRRAGFKAAVSISAGDYVCNQTLFISLERRYAPVIGFIHVPSLATAHCRTTMAPRLSLVEATHAAATAILALAPKLRSRRRFDPAPVPA